MSTRTLVDDPAAVVPRARPPITFVGGTGRSGTHVLAELISRHRRYALVPVESRFHVNPKGFPDVLSGAATPQEFVRKLRRFWWYRVPAGEPLPAVLPRLRLGRATRGLHKVATREQFDEAVARFEAAAAEGALDRACRRLFLDLLWPIAAQNGKRGIVEMSTHNVAHSHELARLFPDAKLIHTVRDGRDAGSSKVEKRQRSHHPRDVVEGVAWWLERIERAERSVAEAPDGYVLTISLDELALGEREESFARLLNFLHIEKPARMRTFFDQQINAQNASRGRWRAGLTEAEQSAVTRAYERAIERLEDQGFPSGSLLRRVYERLG